MDTLLPAADSQALQKMRLKKLKSASEVREMRQKRQEAAQAQKITERLEANAMDTLLPAADSHASLRKRSMKTQVRFRDRAPASFGKRRVQLLLVAAGCVRVGCEGRSLDWRRGRFSVRWHDPN
jgi:hypothetical protein